MSHGQQVCTQHTYRANVHSVRQGRLEEPLPRLVHVVEGALFFSSGFRSPRRRHPSEPTHFRKWMAFFCLFLTDQRDEQIGGGQHDMFVFFASASPLCQGGGEGNLIESMSWELCFSALEFSWSSVWLNKVRCYRFQLPRETNSAGFGSENSPSRPDSFPVV